MTNKTQRVNLTITKKLGKQITEYKKENYLNLSELFRKAVEKRLKKKCPVGDTSF